MMQKGFGLIGIIIVIAILAVFGDFEVRIMTPLSHRSGVFSTEHVRYPFYFSSTYDTPTVPQGVIPSY